MLLKSDSNNQWDGHEAGQRLKLICPASCKSYPPWCVKNRELTEAETGKIIH
jgi:hypothetical protein